MFLEVLKVILKQDNEVYKRYHLQIPQLYLFYFAIENKVSLIKGLILNE